MNQLATLERIVEVKSFPDPEVTRLEIAKVLGYECVVGKDTFKPGDMVVFVFPDTVLPEPAVAPWTEPYQKYSKKRVRTTKIRNFLSFGIIESIDNTGLSKHPEYNPEIYVEGTEVSSLLGIYKYESDPPKDLKVKANKLPYNIPHTDETRWQSLKKLDNLFGSLVDVSLKIDGSSVSYYYIRGDDSKSIPEQFGCTSRNCEMKLDCENQYTRQISKYNIQERLKEYCQKHNVDLCLRGETYGISIQNMSHNPHCKRPQDVSFFSVYNITKGSYEHKGSMHYYINVCEKLKLPVVDTLEENVPLTMNLIRKYDTELKEIHLKTFGKEVPFEGVVIKGSDWSFKVINKHYDLKK